MNISRWCDVICVMMVRGGVGAECVNINIMLLLVF